MTPVYILEFREQESNESSKFDCTSVFVGSSTNRCLKFIKDNPDFSDGIKYNTWFVIIKEYIDYDMFIDDTHHYDDAGQLIAIYDTNGNKLDEQPLK